MAQQINLCTPIFLKQKHYFSALTMGLALTVFVVFGGGLLAYWSWSLKQLGDNYQQAINLNLRELDRLKEAVRTAKDNAGPADAALLQQLQARRSELQQREQLLDELKTGLVQEDTGHSARLRLIAQSIPAQVWVTGVKADDRQFELSGYTLEPAVLNPWMEQLSASPLLRNQKLSTVNVQLVGAELRSGARLAASPVQPAVLARSASHSMWTFTLVNKMIDPVSSGTGDKP
jgi:Tfp pilus assembly protein PilN